MERQRRNQENIAEEMMDIARSLKNNAIAAKTIIVNDNRVRTRVYSGTSDKGHLRIKDTF